VADEATGATVKPVEILIVRKCGGNVGNDEPKADPEEDDDETMDALGKEKVD